MAPFEQLRNALRRVDDICRQDIAMARRRGAPTAPIVELWIWAQHKVLLNSEWVRRRALFYAKKLVLKRWIRTSPDILHDVVQEALLRLGKRRRPLETDWGKKTEQQFLEKTIRGRVYHAIRVYRRFEREQQYRGEFFMELRSNCKSPGAQLDESEVWERVVSVLDTLPERERMLIAMAADGYSLAEIAKAVGLSKSRVWELLAAVRAYFRRIFRD